MNGVKVVSYLLANDAAVIAQVPAARIITGTLPVNTGLPAIGVMKVSGVQTRNVPMGAGRLFTDRIQVTVQAANYAAKGAILALVQTALATRRGTVNGVAVDSILPDVEGPDLDDLEASIFQVSHDFMVTFSQ